jgi:hypothetical protein
MKLINKLRKRYDVEESWLNKFDDQNKLEFLAYSISDRRYYGEFTTEEFVNFIEHFYFDEQFNGVYLRWDKSDRWSKPSCDHIISRSKHGNNSLNNLQFITWLENKIRSDIPIDEWNNLKQNLNKYL